VEILEELDARGIYEAVVPDGFAHALAAYSDAPGRWLI
jgi:hypothetical protein